MSKFISLVVILAIGAGCTINTAGSGQPTTGSAATMQAGTAQVAIHNASVTTVCYLRISPVSDPNWGPDQLGSHVLNAGDTAIYPIPIGDWDFRAEDCSHNEVGVLRNYPIHGTTTLEIQ